MNKRSTGNFRILFIISGMALLISGLLIFGGKAYAQSDTLTGKATLQPTSTEDPTLDPDKLVTSAEIVNPYFTIKNLTLPDGTRLIENIINGPATPPGGYAVEQASAVNPNSATAALLTEVPAFRWVFGCSAVSGSMVAGYYDRTGYPNMYTGPTNGGVVPLAEDASWSTWKDAAGASYPNNPLIASHNGLDGRVTLGSIDDYWVQYSSSASDPYITGGWTQHTWGNAIGDYMKTSQSNYSNTDGSTSFYGYSSSSKLTCSAMQSGGYSQYDGTYGRKLFYEARGYAISDCYYQATDNLYAGGFSLANFKAEIDSGRPVFLNLAGHSIVGVGYDPASTTIYIHDTWDNSNHTMTWGGSYSGMAMQGASIVNLAGTGAPASFNKSAPANGATGQATSLTLSWNATSPVTYYEYCYSTSTGCTIWSNAGNTTSVSISSLSYSTTYYWQVRAWNGNSGPTAANGGTYWTFTTQAAPQPPFTPTGVSATDGTYSDRVRLSWNAATGATYYQVYRNTSNSSTGAALLASPSGSPYDDTSATAGTTYWYFVKACNIAGCSGFSTPDSGYRAVVPVPGAFSKTAPANGALNQPNKVTISWGASAGATSYQYCYSTSTTTCTNWVSNGTATSKTLIGLKKNTTYYWHVRAVNSAGYTYSNDNSPTAFWSFKTK